jgi:hypothetical protein
LTEGKQPEGCLSQSLRWPGCFLALFIQAAELVPISSSLRPINIGITGRYVGKPTTASKHHLLLQMPGAETSLKKQLAHNPTKSDSLKTSLCCFLIHFMSKAGSFNF